MAIIRKLPEVQEKFSEDFFKEIEKSNSVKSLESPKALFLVAEYSFKNFFNDLSANFFILNIAKTHRIAIQIIQKKNQIKPAIESAIKFEGKPQPIDLLVFNSHGDNTCMQLSEKEQYSLNDIKHSDFDGLSPDAEILLFSCKTGNSLAQRIADITRRTVFAPKDRLSFLETSFVFCKEHDLYEMRSYDSKNHPITYRFQEGEPPVLCEEPSSTYFKDLREFIIKKSEQGNSNAQFILGILFEQKEGKIKEAKECYKQAAVQGHSKAQYNMGVIEQKEGKIVEAKIWYRKAAEQGNVDAQYNLGLIEEQAGNIDEAKKWYRKAAEQDDSYAQYNLGLIEEQAGNIDEAKKWYRKAAEQDDKDAQFNLGCIEEQTGNIDEAKKWYFKAAAQGNSDAELKLKLLEKKEKFTPTKRKLPVN